VKTLICVSACVQADLNAFAADGTPPKVLHRTHLCCVATLDGSGIASRKLVGFC